MYLEFSTASHCAIDTKQCSMKSIACVVVAGLWVKPKVSGKEEKKRLFLRMRHGFSRAKLAAAVGAGK